MPDDVSLSATLTQHHAHLEPGRTPPAAPPSGSTRYARGREIGRGGMGRVVEAVNRQFNRFVALKELHAEGKEERRRRFESEALITGHLEHPGIPSVYERGVDELGVPFYVMRKVRGRTLGSLLDEARTLEERLRLLPVIIRSAQTVAYAHEQGVIHRDLKPDNIVVGTHGEAVVLDWGIARVRGVPQSASGEPSGPQVASGGSGTVHGSVVGTPAYMAPEQAAGDLDRIDERSDVFALGALLYHVLAGEGPYDGRSVAELLDLAREARYPKVTSRVRKIPAGLAAICERAMARDPEARYKNAAEMAVALERFEAQAVLGGSRSAVNLFANAIVAIGILGNVVMAIVLKRAMPSFREQGPAVYPLMVFALAGICLSVVEYRTRGRHALGPLTLALTFGTLIVSLGICLTGMEFVLGGLRQQVTDAEAWRTLFTIGAREALGSLVTGTSLAVVQLFFWAAARRRVALEERLRS